MDIMELMKARHSVRQYKKEKISDTHISAIKSEIEAINAESGLHIQLVSNEPKAFDSFMAHYGKFSGVENYIALIGKKGDKLDEMCGYYGERLVLKAQKLGLNTCWVAMTYKKIPDTFKVDKGEKLTVVISLGYGEVQGTDHKVKSYLDVSNYNDSMPKWFKDGVEAALLAPTAMNQQKFTFTYEDGKVSAKAGFGFYSKVDLGIVKYHFEAVTGIKVS